MERIVQVVDGIREDDFDSYTRLSLEAQLRVTTNENSIRDLYDDAFNMLSPLLTLGDIGSKLYDLYISIVDSKSSIRDIRLLLLDFVSTFKISEYLLVSRKFILLVNEDNIELYARASILNSLLIQAYGHGRLIGTTADGKAVVSNEPTSCDYFLWGFKVLSENKKIVKGSTLYVTPSQITLVQKRFKGLYESGLKNYITLHMRHGLHHNNSYGFMRVNSLKHYEYSAVFNFMDEQFSREGNSFDLIQRPENPQLSEEAGKIIDGLVSGICVEVLGRTAVKNRNLYVREKGVTLRFKIPLLGLDSITVREFHNVNADADDHFLVFYYTQTDGYERSFSVPMDNLPQVILTMGNELDSYALMVVLRWLGILDDVTLDSTLDILGSHFKEDKRDSYIKLFKALREWLGTVFNEENFYYETPRQWNYDIKSNPKSLSKQSNCEAPKKIVTVGRYTRRLPAGQKPSAQARKLAAKYYMELKPGYTLVDEFERVARSRVFSN